jgi:hypothetical protein
MGLMLNNLARLILVLSKLAKSIRSYQKWLGLPNPYFVMDAIAERGKANRIAFKRLAKQVWLN